MVYIVSSRAAGPGLYKETLPQGGKIKYLSSIYLGLGSTLPPQMTISL